MIYVVAFSNSDARQTTATAERRIANASYTIRYRNTRQATATIERIIADVS